MGHMRNACAVLLVKREGNRQVARTRHGWMDNIKMILKEVKYEDVNWFYMVHPDGSKLL
jgi:hypothetical protein